MVKTIKNHKNCEDKLVPCTGNMLEDNSIEYYSFSKTDSEKYDVYSEMGTWDECVDRLYCTKEFADVTLITGSGSQQVSFEAHKWILRISSPVFDRMICNSSGAQSDVIKVDDTEPTAVEIMVSHIYKRKIQFSSVEQALNVLSLAIRYELSLLKTICENYIEQLMDAKNACALYQGTLSLRQEEIFYKSFQFLQKETSNVLRQTDLRNLHASTLEDILKQDYLNIDSEFELLKTLVEWAKVQLSAHFQAGSVKNLREMVYPFLKYIRLLCLTREMFVKIQNETRIFSHEEVGKIVMRLEFADWLELPEWFNQMKTSRRYKKDVKPKDIALNNWINLSTKPYSHSEYTRNIQSQFVAKSKDFFIRRFDINICEKCCYRNKICKRSRIKIKISVKTGDIVRGKPCVIYILPGEIYVDRSETPDFYKTEPLILRKQFDKEKLVCKQYVGMDAPILHKYLDNDISELCKIIDVSSSPSSKIVDVNPPLYIKSGEVFSLTIETDGEDLPFYCCRKDPIFDTAPFSAYSDVSQEHSLVWCAFASVYYSFPDTER